MNNFEVPTKEGVSSKNKNILNDLEDKLGFVPNLYATYALSNNALENYLNFNNADTSLSNKEKEVVNLVVSEINGCTYCQSAHTAIAEKNGFTKDQILEIRSGDISFDDRLDALAQLVKNVAKNKGKVNQEVVEKFFASDYTKENLVDTILLIGDKTISNYMHNVFDFPIDFPEAQPLEEALA